MHHFRFTRRPSRSSVLFAAAAISVAAASVVVADPTTQPSSASLKVINRFAVGGEGRWDYVTADAANHRLYVPRSTHVQVLDSETGKQIADWPDTAGVHGVALVADKNLGFASNGQANTVSVFDLKADRRITDVPVGKGPDAITYDAASGNVLVFNHKGGTITLISTDPDAKFRTQEIEVGGALEAGVPDGKGHAFVNVEDKNEVVEFDTKAGTVIAHWPLGKGEGPTGIALDPETHRLFVGCGENNLLAILNADTGEVIDSLPIGAHCDGVDFDPQLKQAYASCGDGTLAVAKEDADGKVTMGESVSTKAGARTISVDRTTHRIYLPTAEFGPAEGGKRPPMKPGTFEILVVGPA